MCSFDPAVASKTMAPNLEDKERVMYLRRELETISDMLDGSEDCKWIYQALIHCTVLISRIEGDISVEARKNVVEWLSELKKLDPLRTGRWVDLEKSLKL
jgi:geranylgeranyl transferase type-2 subunit alpha